MLRAQSSAKNYTPGRRTWKDMIGHLDMDTWLGKVEGLDLVHSDGSHYPFVSVGLHVKFRSLTLRSMRLAWTDSKDKETRMEQPKKCKI